MFFVSLIKEFRNRLQRKLQDNLLEVEKKKTAKPGSYESISSTAMRIKRKKRKKKIPYPFEFKSKEAGMFRVRYQQLHSRETGRWRKGKNSESEEKA